MYLVLLKYLKPFEVIKEYRPAHREYLDKFVANGMLICAGAKASLDGGVFVVRAKKLEEVENFALNDPFALNGLTSHEIIEFNIARHAPAFGVFVD